MCKCAVHVNLKCRIYYCTWKNIINMLSDSKLLDGSVCPYLTLKKLCSCKSSKMWLLLIWGVCFAFGRRSPAVKIRSESWSAGIVLPVCRCPGDARQCGSHSTAQ